jgi:ammonia channel protein AmtB
LLVYAPICHWVWGGGWLGEMGLLDFAGGTVVHINAGVAAIVAAVMLGRRKGFPESAMMPHNLTLVVSGAAMLWGGLVWIQWRQCAVGRWQRGHGHARDTLVGRGRFPVLDRM